MIIVIHTGRSFKGASQYLLHDKRLPGEETRDTQERVAWTHTFNTLEDDPHHVVREMQHTAYNQNFIRREAGNTTACRPTHVTVMTVSLAWEPSQRPDKEQMIEAARSFLEHMRWADHQALLIAHNDTAHPHVHLLINRIHPETGMTLDQNWDRTRASRWGLAYEREHGQVLCHVREFKERGLTMDGHNFPYSQWKMWQDMQREGHVEPEHSAALKSGEWAVLKDAQKHDRLAFWKESSDQRQQLRSAIRDEVKAEYKPEWQAYAKHRDERKLAARLFDQETRRALRHYSKHGPLHGVSAVQQLKERRNAYHDQMKQDLKLQRDAIGQRMKDRFTALSTPALDKHRRDRAHIYQNVLAGQGTDRRQLHHDQGASSRRPDLLSVYAANQNQAQMLTIEQIKAYKDHAISVAAQRAQYAHARGELAEPRARQDNHPPSPDKARRRGIDNRELGPKGQRAREAREARLTRNNEEGKTREQGRDRGGGRER